MKLPDFKTEQWMNDYERQAVCNMTDTCAAPLSFPELMGFDHHHLLDSVTLDYGVIPGYERLRNEILKLYSSGTIDQITLADGCLQANELVMHTLLEPGDRVVTFTPSYQQFEDVPRSLGCEVAVLPLSEASGWQPDGSDLQSAFEKPVKMVILNMPNNPTGSVLKPELFSELLSLCRKHQTWILCDEVYRDPEMQSVADVYEYGISTSSLSKLFSLAGLRLGWVRGPEKLIHLINVRRDYSMISTGPLADTLGYLALLNRDFLLSRSRERISACKAVVKTWLKKEPKASLVMPDYGTVSFLHYEADIPSTKLAQDLLAESGVFFVPGSCFDCEHHLRLTFTADPHTEEYGLMVLSEYLNRSGN